MLTSVDGLVLVDRPVFGQGREIVVVKNTWDDALRNHSLALEVHEARGEDVQALDVEHLQLLEAQDVQVCLREGGVVLLRGQVAPALREIHGEAEEDVVVDEDLLLLRLVRVQSHQVAVNNRDRALDCGFQKVVVDFLDGSVPLHSLAEVFLREILDALELFIPVSDALGVKSVQGYQCS